MKGTPVSSSRIRVPSLSLSFHGPSGLFITKGLIAVICLKRGAICVTVTIIISKLDQE